MDFTKMDANAIITGVGDDGVKYLGLFLKEYTKIFPGTVNAGCPKCLKDYITKYRSIMTKDKNTTGFKLKPKYENMPLAFGSRVLVNSATITLEQVKTLMQYPDWERFFSQIPDQYKEGIPVAESSDVIDDTGETSDDFSGSGSETVENNEAMPDNTNAGIEQFSSTDIVENVSDSATITLEQAYDDAVAHLDSLPEGTHHNTVKAAKRAVEKAMADLEAANK